jgi:hypothetical protein
MFKVTLWGELKSLACWQQQILPMWPVPTKIMVGTVIVLKFLLKYINSFVQIKKWTSQFKIFSIVRLKVIRGHSSSALIII